MTIRVAVVRLSAAPLVCPSDESIFGGAEVRALTFAKGLAASSEFDVRIVVRTGSTRQFTRQDRLIVHPIPNDRHEMDGRSPWRAMQHRSVGAGRRLTCSLSRRITGRPTIIPEIEELPVDILCAFGLHDPTASVIRSANRTGRRSIVFLTSDDDTCRALEPVKSLDRHRRMHRYAIDLADLIVAQTEFQRAGIERMGRPVVLIRNPIDTRLAQGEPEPMGRRQYVLWIGRADTDCKRADLCMELARRCGEVPFLVVMNPQDPTTTNRLTKQAPSNVQIVDRLDWQASDSVFRHAIALLNTSDVEGFPNAFLQAAKHGVPLVSRRVNPDGVLTKHGIGFVANDDMSKLAQTIRRLYQEPHRFSAVSASARRYVQRYHSLSERIDELQWAIESLSHDRDDRSQAARRTRSERLRQSAVLLGR